ncbi:MAG: uroporphyrinogen decarboxylase family protein [Anaerolineae bacterium]
MPSRTELLTLLNGQRLSRTPRFSGLINITTPGLDALGLRLSEIHTDATKLAAAAATSHRLFGWESAVVPADLCVEASVLGADVDFQTDVDKPMWPVVAAPLAANAGSWRLRFPYHIAAHPRVATVVRAIRLLQAGVGQYTVVGAWVPGPLTLAMQVLPIENLYADIREDRPSVARVLDILTDLIIVVARIYHNAGADFLTIHEMGGSPGVLGPETFQELILPRLQRLLAALPAPRVLSICGNTNRAMHLLAQAGAEALSVDQTNHLAPARALLGDRILLFGNIDPVKVLAQGSPRQVHQAVRRAQSAGADAIWPGCDLPPNIPAENLRAFVE